MVRKKIDFDELIGKGCPVKMRRAYDQVMEESIAARLLTEDSELSDLVITLSASLSSAYFFLEQGETETALIGLSIYRFLITDEEMKEEND